MAVLLRRRYLLGNHIVLCVLLHRIGNGDLRGIHDLLQRILLDRVVVLIVDLRLKKRLLLYAEGSHIGCLGAHVLRMLLHPLISELRHGGNLIHRDIKHRRLAGEVRVVRIGLREGYIDLELLTLLRADQLILEAIDEAAGAEYEVVAGA